MSIAVVLISGGLDSCVTAAIADQTNDLAFLHVRYSQRTEKREQQSFRDICRFYKPKHRLEIQMKYFSNIGGSALTDKSIEVPEKIQGKTPQTYVPFRNGNILSAAASWAETIGAEKIYIGAVEEDSSGYPDCTEEFLRKFETAVNAGTKPETKIKIIAPLLHYNKGEIVKKGIALGAPLHLTWSCYQNERIACGKCDSCRLRLKGFDLATERDTISYA
ncbi:7-cyano-7-deazaguanine synthase QueC [bacterium]|nr:7-cyano-7-deazaguanine synthase QueC [bacterium]